MNEAVLASLKCTARMTVRAHQIYCTLLADILFDMDVVEFASITHTTACGWALNVTERG